MDFFTIKIGRNYKKSFKFWEYWIALQGICSSNHKKPSLFITNDYFLPTLVMNLLPDAASA